MSDTYSRTGWPTDAERIVIRQNGQAEVIAQAQSAQAAYEEWLGTEAGQAAKEHAEVFALHLAFDGGYGARDEWLRHTREEMEDNRSKH